MAETTTAINACDAQIYLDNASGTPVEISGSSNSAELGRTRDTSEYTVFGTQWKKRTQCKKDGTLNINVVYTTAASEAMDLFNQWFDAGGRRTVIIDVPNSNIGSDRYYGEFLLTNLPMPFVSDEAGPVMVAAELLPDGPIHRTTVGS